MMTMFWKDTKTKEDAMDLYEELGKFIDERTFTDVVFRTEIHYQFAYELLNSLYNGAIAFDDIKKYVRLKGFTDLKKESWTNMILAKTRVHEDNVRSCYSNGYGGWMDGW